MDRILIACEYSGRVRRAFRKRGIDAWSCDIKPDMYLSPYHIQADVLSILDNEWSAMIAFPPCTYLSNAGNAHRWRPERDDLVDLALNFVNVLMNASIKHICIENPVGVINTEIRKPDQIIHPYMFGEPWKKRTCLWLKNLPVLKPTKMVTPRAHWVSSGSNARSVLGLSPMHDYSKRDLTFKGIAAAMADQWGDYV